MLEGIKQESEVVVDPLDALRAEGYRSVFSVVGSWTWCPHCGLKCETTSIVPVKSVAAAADDGQAWHAITCVRCHARGLLLAGKSD